MVWNGLKLVPPPTSLARPCRNPTRCAPAKSKNPLPRNRLLVGLTAAAAPLSRSNWRSGSSRWMQCAYTARSRSRPKLRYTSRYERACGYSSRTHLTSSRFSATWEWIQVSR